MLHWYVSPSILRSAQSFRLAVLLHKEILLLECHNTITSLFHQVTTASQSENDSSGAPQRSLSIPSARTGMFLVDALRSQGSRKKQMQCSKEEQDHGTVIYRSDHHCIGDPVYRCRTGDAQLDLKRRRQ